MRNKHINEVPPTFQQYVLQRFELIDGTISSILTENRFKSSVSKARIAENNDTDLNMKKNCKIVISGLLDFIEQFFLLNKKTNKLNCDGNKLLKFLQCHIPNISKIKTQIISNTKIGVTLETPQMAYIVKEKLESLEGNDINVDFLVTIGTQVRKKILMALANYFVANGLEAHMLPHHHHQPKISVRIPGQKHFEKYSFADAMEVFQSTFESEDLIDQSIHDLAEKMPPGTNVEDIFVVL